MMHSGARLGLPLLILTAAISGCASNGGGTQSQAAGAQEAPAQDSRYANYEKAVAAVEQAQHKLEQAHQDQLDYYAPQQLEEAEELWQETESTYLEFQGSPDQAGERYSLLSFSSQTYAEKAIEQATAVEAKLQDGYTVKETVQTLLADALELKGILTELNVKQYFPQEYEPLERRLRKLIEYISEGDNKDAQEGHAELLPKLVALEVKTVKHVTLSGFSEQLNDLHRDQAHRLAPKTYATAEQAYNLAEAFIAANPRDKEGIAAAAAKVEHALAHTQQIAQKVEKLRAIDKRKLEDVVLEFEALLQHIGQSLEQPDIRDRSLKEQSQTLAAAATALVQGNQKTLTGLAGKDKEIAKLQQQLAQLNKQLKAKDLQLQQQTELLQEKKTAHAQLQTRQQLLKGEVKRLQQKLSEKEVALQALQAKTADSPSEPATEAQPAASEPVTAAAETQAQPAEQQTQTTPTETVLGTSDN